MGITCDKQIYIISCYNIIHESAQTTVPPTEPTSPKPFECPASSGSFPVSPDACKPDYYMCVDYTPYPQVFSSFWVTIFNSNKPLPSLCACSLIDLPWKPRL